jgi:hypothetical protein
MSWISLGVMMEVYKGCGQDNFDFGRIDGRFHIPKCICSQEMFHGDFGQVSGTMYTNVIVIFCSVFLNNFLQGRGCYFSYEVKIPRQYYKKRYEWSPLCKNEMVQMIY